MVYTLKSDEKRIIVNDNIQGDPLSEENLDKTLECVNRFRLLLPEKTIWLYTGYVWKEIFQIWDDWEYLQYPHYDKMYPDKNTAKRQRIIRQCDVLVDGRYIDSQRDVSLCWRGSKNQRVINVQESLKQNKIVLYWN